MAGKTKRASDDIYFKSAEHKQRLVTAIQRIGKVYGGKLDPEYASALYILTADSATWDMASGYVGRDGIGFEEMMQENYFSETEATPIKLAWNLFNGQGRSIDPLDLVWLDQSNFRLALTALWIRRDGVRMEDL